MHTLSHIKNKKMEELIIDGIWKHRPNELSPVQFEYLSEAAKGNYLFKIAQIEPELRSTYEKIILRRYEKEQELKAHNGKKILEEKESSTETNVSVCAPLPVEDLPTVQELKKMGVQYLYEYLDEFFKFEYSDWETNVRFHPVDKFVNNTKNFMEIDQLTYVHICAYKELKSN